MKTKKIIKKIKNILETLKEEKGITIFLLICIVILCCINCYQFHSLIGILYTFIIIIVGTLIGWVLSEVVIKLFTVIFEK